tara:strand:- start:423 stop:1433 length:1011 start_codon:yes stop_codon:yes gene_type:complete
MSPFFAKTDDHHLVAGDQMFTDDVQIGGTLQGRRKEIVTATNGQGLGIEQSGATVILGAGINVKLPKPQVGVSYDFILTADLAEGSDASITSVYNDSGNPAALMKGIVDTNGSPTAISNHAAISRITFDGGKATEGDFCKVECVTTGATTAGYGFITAVDGDATTSATEKEYITIIDGNRVEKKYVIVDNGGTPSDAVVTGTVLASDSDTGAGTAGTSLVGGIAVAINAGTTPQATVLSELWNAITGSQHSASFTSNCTTGSLAPANGNQILALTSSIAGQAGYTWIDSDIAAQQFTFSNFAPSGSGDWSANAAAWSFDCKGDDALSINTTSGSNS